MSYQTKRYIKAMFIFLLGLYLGLSAMYFIQKVGYSALGFVTGLIIANAIGFYGGFYSGFYSNSK